LNGVLAAVLIAQLLIVFIWKPIFLFRWSLHTPVHWYIWLYLRCLLPVVLGWGACWLLVKVLPIDPQVSFWWFLLYAVCIGTVALGVSFAVMLFTEKGIRGFWGRIWTTIRPF
jgi:hypothetical protein